MKPYYRLKVLQKSTQQTAHVGAGWLNEDGSITLRIDPCVNLVNNSDMVYTFFIIDEKPKVKK